MDRLIIKYKKQIKKKATIRRWPNRDKNKSDKYKINRIQSRSHSKKQAEDRQIENKRNENNMRKSIKNRQTRENKKKQKLNSKRTFRKLIVDKGLTK